MKTARTKDTKDNLCDYCKLSIPECPKPKHIKFGNGIGNDNVTECSEFIVETTITKELLVAKVMV